MHEIEMHVVNETHEIEIHVLNEMHGFKWDARFWHTRFKKNLPIYKINNYEIFIY